ncbi:putative translation initiation factor eIF-2B subunit epsilon [Triangularia verruculosa]|uniref:Mannose-1-phosphate guanyltransferase n=1 Tax=Triangularia verruculosa TaxID=2587418 RepID=A0AAN7AQ40_9PEZI|nr:putative translation initiation factor eIF-2B subunit epsilon [Triangularia verruculosa]
MSKQGGKGAASKGKKPAKAGGDDKREDALQAVIIADYFQDRFRPFTLDKPRCLLPLVNVPVIEYTLEFLALNGVQEVFIYCGTHSEDIEQYIQESIRWNPSSIICPFSSLEFIRVSDATSVGDFLRDLDKRSLISGDFILVHGDCVANIQLDPVLAKHRARREANGDACMTVVLRSVGEEPHRAAKARGITPVFVVDDTDSRCLQYDEIHPLIKDRRLMLDQSVFKHESFSVRSDLIDCGIDICTPDVLALWSESFDYELPRKNFLHGVLKDWELNGKLIYTEIVEDAYAARASNLQMYDCISKDILERWVLPFAPDSNLMHDQSYRKVKNNSYVESGVVVERGSKVLQSAVGKYTSVRAGSSISGSVIGRRCVIGRNVNIKDSYIFDGTVIEDGAVIVHSILAGDVKVGANAHIPEGSLISYNVEIDRDVRLPTKPPARISAKTDYGEPVENDASLVGPNGKGAAYEVVDDDSDSDSEEEEDGDPAQLQNNLIYSLEGLNISTLSVSTLASSDDYDSDEDDEHAGYLHAGDGQRERLSSFTSDDSSKPDAFHGDAVNGLVDALRGDDNEDFDSAKLEFMGLRLANNASDSSMRRAIAVAFTRRAAEMLSPEHGGLEPSKAAERVLRGKNGAAKFIRDVGVGGDGVKPQVEFALALQKGLVSVKGLESGRAGTLLAALLQQLYSLDVLEEDGILAWWADKRAAEGETMTKVKEKCKVLVDWLEEADEEDSDEDEDEDSD